MSLKTIFSEEYIVNLEKGERSTWSKPFLFIPGAITFWLGTWQLDLAKEKVRMLEYRQSRLEMEPLKGNQTLLSNDNLDSLDFRRILCKGVYDEKKSIYVARRSWKKYGFVEDGGYNLITPLIPVPGDPESVQSPILVNRGWVPQSFRDKALDASKNDELLNSSSTNTQRSAKISRRSFWYKKPQVIKVQVTGVARRTEKPNILSPANDPASSKWFTIDSPALARACGLPDETIYVEDLNESITSPSSSYPVRLDVNMLTRSPLMPDDHINLSAAMYVKSAIATFIAIKKLKPRKGSV